MVRGVGIAVTKVAGRNQWAETQSTARGRGMCLPMVAQPSVQALCDNAFIGLPCPKKITGIGLTILNIPHFVLHQRSFYFSSEPAGATGSCQRRRIATSRRQKQ